MGGLALGPLGLENPHRRWTVFVCVYALIEKDFNIYTVDRESQEEGGGF